MIKKYCLFICLFSFLLIHSSFTYGQYIIAGQYGANDVYMDVVPDYTLPMLNGAPIGYLADSIKLDIDQDGIFDFFIYSGGGGGLGGGSESTTIVPLSTDNFVSTFPDTSYYGPPPLYVVDKVPVAHITGDSISQLFPFTNSYSDFFASHYGNFAAPTVIYWNNIGEHYVAVKLIVPNDTLYGWIRVQVDGIGQITIKDYACNKNPNHTSISTNLISNEVSIFPNPSNSDLHIILNSSEPQTITVHTAEGALVNTITINPNAKYFIPGKYEYVLNTVSLAQGIYILTIDSPSERITKRFVVTKKKQ